MHNFDLRIYLTQDQIAKANEIFFEIAQNLVQKKRATRNSEQGSLTDEVRALLIAKIRMQDHLNFKTMAWLHGIGGIDIVRTNQDCGCFSDSITGNESRGEENGER